MPESTEVIPAALIRLSRYARFPDIRVTAGKPSSAARHTPAGSPRQPLPASSAPAPDPVPQPDPVPDPSGGTGGGTAPDPANPPGENPPPTGGGVVGEVVDGLLGG